VRDHAGGQAINPTPSGTTTTSTRHIEGITVMVSNYEGPYWTREGGAQPQWRDYPRGMGWTDADSREVAWDTGGGWYWSEERRCYLATRDGQTTPADLAERIATGDDGGVLAAQFWVMAARVAANAAAWRLDAAVLADAAAPTIDTLATLTAAQRAHDTALATLAEVETIGHQASTVREGVATSLDSAPTTEATRSATARELGEREDLARAEQAHRSWEAEGDERALWTELGEAAPGVRAAFWNARAQRGLGPQARITPRELASAHREASRPDAETPHDSATYPTPTPVPGAARAARDIDAAHERVVDAAGTLQMARATLTCDSLGVLAEAQRAYDAAVAARDALLDLDERATDSTPGSAVLDDGYLTCPASSHDPRVRTDAGATDDEDLDCTLGAGHDDGGQHLASSGIAWVDPAYTGPGLAKFPTEPDEVLAWTDLATRAVANTPGLSAAVLDAVAAQAPVFSGWELAQGQRTRQDYDDQLAEEADHAERVTIAQYWAAQPIADQELFADRLRAQWLDELELSAAGDVEDLPGIIGDTTGRSADDVLAALITDLDVTAQVKELTDKLHQARLASETGDTPERDRHTWVEHIEYLQASLAELTRQQRTGQRMAAPAQIPEHPNWDARNARWLPTEAARTDSGRDPEPPAAAPVTGKTISPSDLNERNRERWAYAARLQAQLDQAHERLAANPHGEEGLWLAAYAESLERSLWRASDPDVAVTDIPVTPGADTETMTTEQTHAAQNEQAAFTAAAYADRWLTQERHRSTVEAHDHARMAAWARTCLAALTAAAAADDDTHDTAPAADGSDAGGTRLDAGGHRNPDDLTAHEALAQQSEPSNPDALGDDTPGACAGNLTGPHHGEPPGTSRAAEAVAAAHHAVHSHTQRVAEASDQHEIPTPAAAEQGLDHHDLHAAGFESEGPSDAQD
jgi:hypothetical protein